MNADEKRLYKLRMQESLQKKKAHMEKSIQVCHSKLVIVIARVGWREIAEPVSHTIVQYK